MRDAAGQTIPTYDQTVVGFAKVFTGWTLVATTSFRRVSIPPKRTGHWRWPVANHHSTGPKLLTGWRFPAGQTAQKDPPMHRQHRNHPNVGPFMSKWLIQSGHQQSSPAYMTRVVAVWNNNGAGVPATESGRARHFAGR